MIGRHGRGVTAEYGIGVDLMRVGAVGVGLTSVGAIVMSVTPAGFGVLSSGSRVGVAWKTRAGPLGIGCGVLCVMGLRPRDSSTSIAQSNCKGVGDVMEVRV